MVDEVVRSLDKMPDALVLVLQRVHRTTVYYFPNSGFIGLASALFLRFINSALANPISWIISETFVALESSTRTALAKVAKTLQSTVTQALSDTDRSNPIYLFFEKLVKREVAMTQLAPSSDCNAGLSSDPQKDNITLCLTLLVSKLSTHLGSLDLAPYVTDADPALEEVTFLKEMLVRRLAAARTRYDTYKDSESLLENVLISRSSRYAELPQYPISPKTSFATPSMSSLDMGKLEATSSEEEDFLDTSRIRDQPLISSALLGLYKSRNTRTTTVWRATPSSGSSGSSSNGNTVAAQSSDIKLSAGDKYTHSVTSLAPRSYVLRCGLLTGTGKRRDIQVEATVVTESAEEKRTGLFSCRVEKHRLCEIPFSFTDAEAPGTVPVFLSIFLPLPIFCHSPPTQKLHTCSGVIHTVR